MRSALLTLFLLAFLGDGEAFTTSRLRLTARHGSSSSYEDADSIGLTGHAPQQTPETERLAQKDHVKGLTHTRRDLLEKFVATSILSTLRPASAAAAPAVGSTAVAKSAIVSQTLCDPAVSTWAKGTRLVHLLGTAHISSTSAELAGRMVREVKPDVVFVELDKKRVGRAGLSSIENNTQQTGASTSITESAGSVNEQSGSSVASSSFVSTPTIEAPTSDATRSSPFDVQSRIESAGAQQVGNAMKGMYGKLESEGFKAGDEFARSVREGLTLGSTIVLGDRDVEVTLKRLTRAITKTDIRKLFSSDSEVEKSMESLLPQDMKDSLQKKQSSNGGIDSMNVSEDVYISKSEFTDFVETMKAKENVKVIMGALKKSAPEIYTAMVAERDEYMANGLDQLDTTLAGKKVDSTCAVVGMAHVDGIETILADRGWKQMSYPCPVVR